MADPIPADESAEPGVSISDNIFHGAAAVLGSGVMNNSFYVNSVPAGPKFDTAPSSLRPPYIDPARVWGRETELRRIGELATTAPNATPKRIVVVTGPGGSENPRSPPRSPHRPRMQGALHSGSAGAPVTPASR